MSVRTRAHTSLGFTLQLYMCGSDPEQQSIGFENYNEIKPLCRAHSILEGLMCGVEPKQQSRGLYKVSIKSRWNMQSELTGVIACWKSISPENYRRVYISRKIEIKRLKNTL